MKQNIFSKVVVTLILLAITMVSVVACGTKHEAVKGDKDPKVSVEDKYYTEELKKEKEVQSGQVYIQDGMAIGAMIIKDTVSDEDATKLAEKYAAELKRTYTDMKVNVQAVKNGNNIANILLD